MEKIVQPPAPPPQPPVPPSIPPVCPRVTLTDQDIEKLDKEGLILKWKELDNYVTIELGRTGDPTTDDKLHLQQQEATRKENVLMMRLATKEQEMQELLTQVQELKQAQTPSAQQLQTMLIDPAVNLLFEKMKTELTETKDRLEQAQNDLSAWKFTPDSVTGKKLMAKCRTLIQENQELGKQLSQGRIAQLEAELSLQKKYSEELKGSQDEMNEFVIQLDEEVEGMQATICALQQQLKEAKQRSDKLGTENQKLRTRIEELLSSKQTNNEKQDSAAIETLDNNLRTGEHSAKRTDIRSPERNNKQERTANKQERTKDSTTSNRELLSPANNREHLSPSSKNGELLSSSISQEERMEVDSENKKESTKDSTTPQQKNESNKKIDHKENSENRPPQKTVITRRSAEKKNVEASNTSYVSPPKGVTKTSFSINDLLAGGKGCIKKDGDSPTKFSTSEHQTQENGENGALNGEIDDSVI